MRSDRLAPTLEPRIFEHSDETNWTWRCPVEFVHRDQPQAFSQNRERYWEEPREVVVRVGEMPVRTVPAQRKGEQGSADRSLHAASTLLLRDCSEGIKAIERRFGGVYVETKFLYRFLFTA